MTIIAGRSEALASKLPDVQFELHPSGRVYTDVSHHDFLLCNFSCSPNTKTYRIIACELSALRKPLLRLYASQEPLLGLSKNICRPLTNSQFKGQAASLCPGRPKKRVAGSLRIRNRVSSGLLLLLSRTAFLLQYRRPVQYKENSCFVLAPTQLSFGQVCRLRAASKVVEAVGKYSSTYLHIYLCGSVRFVGFAPWGIYDNPGKSDRGLQGPTSLSSFILG